MLSGLTFSVKDLFDVRGLRRGCGSRAWLAAFPEAAEEDAEAVALIRSAGAAFVGKTQQDEMAWSLTGMNSHYGTPPNPARPDCIPGGSSSGAASSVAANLCDFALGSDTAGSIRIPASHCGLYGMRPTHSRVPTAGATPLAPSFDSVGTLARTLPILTKSMSVLLHDYQTTNTAATPPRWLVSSTLLDLAEAKERFAEVATGLGAAEVEVGDLEQGVKDFSTIQMFEVWKAHGAWVKGGVAFDSEGVAQRFAKAKEVPATDAAEARQRVDALYNDFEALLGSDGVLILPAAPTAAPPCNQVADDAWRTRVLRLTILASLTGCPQLVVPFIAPPNGPVGISLIGPRGSDERLLHLAGTEEFRALIEKSVGSV